MTNDFLKKSKIKGTSERGIDSRKLGHLGGSATRPLRKKRPS